MICKTSLPTTSKWFYVESSRNKEAYIYPTPLHEQDGTQGHI